MIVGLTGGIGSGKTTVAGFFKEFDIPVYIADEAGKRLMNTSLEIRKKIIDLFGTEAYENDLPDRKFIASQVFNDKEKLSALNKIIHPAVKKDFSGWLEKQSSAYVIYEAAILFETGGYKQSDFNILVTAPKNLKIERLQERDHSSVEEIEARMGNQWDDEKKSEMADFLINNKDLAKTKEQVAHIHHQILKAGKNS